jgi:DNA-binding CsgD family transcriptional regulator
VLDLPTFKGLPLVGRASELELITTSRLRNEASGVVIEGPAGVGKSRLAREALDLAAAEGAFIEWVQATRSTATVSMGAVANLLQGVASETPLGILRGCDRALKDRAGGRPIVLAIDDAHLLDPQSASLILHLVAASTGFVIVTLRDGEARPDAIVSLWKDLWATRMELGPLDERETGELLEVALGGAAEREMHRWAFDRSEGNVLYLRELLTGAASDGSLGSSSGLWRLSRTPSPSRSLSDLAAERLADLDEAASQVLDFLALGEPLSTREAIGLVGVEPLVVAEESGIVVVRDDWVSLSQPLYGEVTMATMPAARAHEVRLKLADAFQGRGSLKPGEALRVARWLLDAGAPVPDEILLAAAEAAIVSGDADLGAGLAERGRRSGPETARASLLLARAHSQRKRYEEAAEVLAEVEGELDSPEEALEHLRQRIPALYFGLKRSTEAVELLDRAGDWWPGTEWQRRLGALRLQTQALTKGWAKAVEDGEAMLADPGIDASTKRGLESVHAASLFYSGRELEASEFSRRIRPTFPLRDSVDSIAFTAAALIDALVGDDWPGLEAWVSESLDQAVRHDDREAVGLAALSLGTMAFLQGRQRLATRWLAEAEAQLERSDDLGFLVVASATSAGVACARGDAAAASAALERCRAELGGQQPLPNQAPLVSLAEGWAAVAAGDLEAARKLLVEKATETFEPAYATEIFHEALRIGEPAESVVDSMRAWGGETDGPLSSAYIEHTIALAPPDADALARCAERFEQIGALSNAIECVAQSAEAFAAAGDQDSARKAAATVTRLQEELGEGVAPEIVGIDTSSLALTARQEEIVRLAREGLTNAEIAERLVLSVRTVESHMYRAMAKLGIDDRHELHETH